MGRVPTGIRAETPPERISDKSEGGPKSVAGKVSAGAQPSEMATVSVTRPKPMYRLARLGASSCSAQTTWSQLPERHPASRDGESGTTASTSQGALSQVPIIGSE